MDNQTHDLGPCYNHRYPLYLFQFIPLITRKSETKSAHPFSFPVSKLQESEIGIR